MKAMSFSALVRDFFSSAACMTSRSLKLLFQGWMPILLVMSGGVLYSLFNLYFFLCHLFHWPSIASIYLTLCFVIFAIWSFCVNTAFSYWYTLKHEGRRMSWSEAFKDGSRRRLLEMTAVLLLLFALLMIFSHLSMALIVFAFCCTLVLPSCMFLFRHPTHAFAHSMWSWWERPILFLYCVLLPIILNFFIVVSIALCEKWLLHLSAAVVWLTAVKLVFAFLFYTAVLFCFSWYLTLGIVLADRYIPVQFPRIYLKRRVKLREHKRLFSALIKKITAFTESCDDEFDTPADQNESAQSGSDDSSDEKNKTQLKSTSSTKAKSDLHAPETKAAGSSKAKATSTTKKA